MTDLRSEIPKRAFLNAEITQEMVKTSAFSECLKMVQQKYDLQEYQFLNPAYVISLLYCLLVVPKEIWLKGDPHHPIYLEIGKRNPLKYFKLEVPIDTGDRFFRSPVYSLLRGLRNSVAHARFAVDQDMTFTFWDQRNENAPEHFRVSISADSLMAFLSQVGSLLANLPALG